MGRDSQPQYLGMKVGNGEYVNAGAVIVRQRGTRIHPGKNVKRGKDDTLFSTVAGIVTFNERKHRRFDRTLVMTKFANVIPPRKA